MKSDSDTSDPESRDPHRSMLRVLIVEDSEDDALLAVRELQLGGYEPEWRLVETPEAMGAALRDQEWDVVLADYQMPRFTAPGALRLLQDIGRDLPFIVISGTVGEDVAVEVMKAGAHDFFTKGSLKLLVPAIQREIGEAENRRRTIAAEKDRDRALERERHLNAVLRSIRDVNQLIVREKERRPFIEAACRSLLRTRGFRGAWIVLTDRLPDELLSAQSGFPDEVFRVLGDQIREDRLPICCKRAVSEGGVAAIGNPGGECGGCPLALAYDGGSGLGVSLILAGREFGCMGVSVPPECAVDDDEKSLLAEIAGDIALALHGMDVEAERKRSEQTQKAIFDSASDGILLADAKTNRFVKANKAICRMVGYNAEEIKRLSVDDIHPAEDLDRVRSQYDREARGEITLAEDIPVKRKDGTVFPADVSSAPLELDGRRHVLGIFRDITDRKSVV
jgi:PAS domain S-box-containing protein